MSAPRPESAGGELTERERRILEDLAGHENAGDPGFVVRMNAPMTFGDAAPEPDPEPVGRPDDGSGIPSVFGTGRPASAEDAAVDPAERARWSWTVKGLLVLGVLVLVLPPAVTIMLILVVAPSLLALAMVRGSVLGGRPDGSPPHSDEPPRTDPRSTTDGS